MGSYDCGQGRLREHGRRNVAMIRGLGALIPEKSPSKRHALHQGNRGQVHPVRDVTDGVDARDVGAAELVHLQRKYIKSATSFHVLEADPVPFDETRRLQDRP